MARKGSGERAGTQGRGPLARTGDSSVGAWFRTNETYAHS